MPLNSINSKKLHEESIIIDGLNTSWFSDVRVLQHLQEGGVTAVHATIAAWHSPLETSKLLGKIFFLCDRYSDIIMLIESVDDIRKAKDSKRVGLILGFQDTAPIDDMLGLLNVYHELGVRVIQLTYNNENLVGCGCQDEKDNGLTDYGRKVVREMNRLGILVDVSHCGPRTTLEAIDASAVPIAFTHANPYALHPHPRNKSDEAILSLAKRGGVIGATQFPLLVTDQYPATLSDYIDIIDYLVNLVGIDHVGLGTNFMEFVPEEVVTSTLQGFPLEVVLALSQVQPMQGFETAAQFANVTAALVQRGYGASDVQKIMGGNWLRLDEAVW